MRKDCAIYTASHVQEVHGGAPATVRVKNGFTVTADSVVVATNTPINDRFAIHTKQESYRSYVIACEIADSTLPPGLFWDTLQPYHYIRSYQGHGKNYLVLGGEDHVTGQSTDEAAAWARLEEWGRERFPGLKSPAYTWSGQIHETVDGLGFIGKNPMDRENVYIATGDCGMGLTHGAIAGMLLSDLIMGRENPWQKVYEPSRRTLKAAGSWLGDNLNTIIQYADHLTPGEVGFIDDIEPGEGAIIRRGLEKIACYRDHKGVVHQVSANCPHLGGVVRWNSAEKTWDCPCHGSRFSAEGKVLNGPAIDGLRAIAKPGRVKTPSIPTSHHRVATRSQ